MDCTYSKSACKHLGNETVCQQCPHRRNVAQQLQQFIKKVNAPAKSKSKGMNKAETFYSYELERQRQHGEIRTWKFEAIRFILAERTTYTPDFLVWMKNGDICLHEVKAVWRSTGKSHWEDDARAKIKIAAELFPEFQFYGVWWDGGQFNYEYFGSRNHQ